MAKIRNAIQRRQVDDENSNLTQLEKVYREEAPRLTRYFRRHLRENEDVPDLVQETFLRLASANLGMRCQRPAAYLQRIARNLLFDRSRQSSSAIMHARALNIETLTLAVPADQADQIERDDVMRLYLQAVSELPPRTREVFLLHRVEGLPYREIGGRLGISIPTVQYHIARALVHIDRALSQE